MYFNVKHGFCDIKDTKMHNVKYSYSLATSRTLYSCTVTKAHSNIQMSNKSSVENFSTDVVVGQNIIYKRLCEDVTNESSLFLVVVMHIIQVNLGIVHVI